MTLSNPLRLEIKKRMTAALQEITVAGGYSTEIGVNVFRGRIIYGDTDPLPMITILEAPIPQDPLPSPHGATYGRGLWELMVQGFVQDDRANPTDPADLLLADIRKRLSQERRKTLARPPSEGIFGLGNHITDLIIGPGVVRPPDEYSAKAYCWLTIQLEMAEDLANPFGEA